MSQMEENMTFKEGGSGGLHNDSGDGRSERSSGSSKKKDKTADKIKNFFKKKNAHK